MDTASELSDEKIDQLNLNLGKRLKACTVLDKAYVKNVGGGMVCVAAKDAEKYASRPGWGTPSKKELDAYLNKAATKTEPTKKIEDGEGDGESGAELDITAGKIRSMNTKTFNPFVEEYGEALKDVEFGEDDTLPQKKDKVIKALGLEE